jgi:hypothetical protein
MPSGPRTSPNAEGVEPLARRVESGETVSAAIIGAVSTAADRPMVPAVESSGGAESPTLEPLSEWIDPEAVDRLFSPEQSPSAVPKRLTFSYGQYEVTVETADRTTVHVSK